MTTKSRVDRRCAYVVSIERTETDGDDLRPLADYLSQLGTLGCEVVVLDSSPESVYRENRRVLRWVSRHVSVHPPVDVVRMAAAATDADRIIVAREDMRYGESEITNVCELLEMHEVVEPQDYVAPLPWWGSVEAGRILIHRGIEPCPDRGATFAFRRSALSVLRGFEAAGAADPVRRMGAFGAEVFSAFELFVRREPGAFREWIRECARGAAADFAQPAKTALFFALIPATALIALFAGPRIAGGFAVALAFLTLLLAVRGRIGASDFFPLRTCLFAPLWLVERAVSVYCALVMKLQQSGEPARAVVAERGRGEKVASGE